MIEILRKIRFFFYRRKQRLKSLKFLGKPSYIDSTSTFSFHENISIGKYCRIGRNNHLDGEGGLTIGDGTILAPHVTILTSSHNYKQDNFLPYDTKDIKKSVIIGKGCWLGWGSTIIPGVVIGDGAVVAMGSVVTKEVYKGQIVGGNPARVINNREEDITKMIDGDNYFIKYKIENGIIRKGRKTKIKKNLIT